jgi:hypothetical protein
MAKSVISISHSGIRRDCACLSGAVGCWQSPPKATISVPSGRGEVRLNFVRSREQGGLVTDRSACKYVLERGWNVWTCFLWPCLLFLNRRTPADGESASEYPSVLRAALRRRLRESSYLVDPASSHMLVSKIKPCMSKYKQICTVKLRMAH